MPPRERKTINLALQGGGTHGAFTWGVLDRLLEEEALSFEGISGTSAGAMNAAVLAYGLATGGRAGAREALSGFWKRVSQAHAFTTLQPTWLDTAASPGNLDYSPGYVAMEAMTRVFSPYELNPSGTHPLRKLLDETVDFERLRAAGEVKLFTCAANVRTNRIRVFETHEQTPDTVLASACLPTMFQAVEIAGEHYWDGGYLGNPPIFPLIYHCESRDVLLAMINPIEIDEVPRTARAILDRLNTLSFNSSLMREMRAINFVSGLVEKGFDDGGRLKRMLIHTVEADDRMRALSASSKVNGTWSFLQWLHALGRERAEAFLATHYDRLGRESSTDIAARFL